MTKHRASTEEAVKRRRDLAMAREAGADLTESVSAWVRALGGVPLHVDDIRAKEIRKGSYRVSVRVKGTWPRTKYALK